jgi:Concanavalin A-like lectin/glucanases superfamily
MQKADQKVFEERTALLVCQAMSKSTLRSLFLATSALITSAAFAACVGDEPAPTKNQTDAATTASDGPVSKPDDAAADTTAPSDPLCNAVISYWPGEGSGADLKGSNTLIWRPMGTDARYAPGVLGQAFFIATTATNTAYLDTTVSQLANATSFTIAFWFKQATNKDADIFKLALNGQTLFLLQIQNTNKLIVSIGAPLEANPAAGILPLSVFNHVAITLTTTPTTSTINTFVNGELVNVATLKAAITKDYFKSGLGLTVGQPNLGAVLDEVTLFNRGIEKDEVKKLFTDGLTCSGPLARPDAGVIDSRCAAPMTASPLPCGTSVSGCNAPQVCCPFNPIAPSCTSTGLCSPASVVNPCAKQSDCGGTTFCCASVASNKISSTECSNVTTPPTSQCKASCDTATETPLCVQGETCRSGTKCTGFRVGASTTLYGACVP